VLPLQQPLGHELAVHTHAPPEHVWPAPQTDPPDPHEQPPFTHRSALAPHVPQVAPGAPHCAVEVVVTHAPDAQHPFAHPVESHTHCPLTQ